jgi:hypothetical protein
MKHSVTITIKTQEAYSSEADVEFSFEPAVEREKPGGPTTVELYAVRIMEALGLSSTDTFQKPAGERPESLEVQTESGVANP